MNVFLACGLIFIFALIISRLLRRIRLPAVSSYFLLGIVIGPYAFDLLPKVLIESTDLLGYFVLGLVAYLLGENFLWRQFKRAGKKAIIISIPKVIGAFIFVAVLLRVAGVPLYEALVFAGIASPSAPTATYMVVRELRARGNFTQTLVRIVAIDDAWGIMLFAVAVVMAKFFHPTSSETHIAHLLLTAGKEIFGAIALGGVLSILFYFLSRYMRIEREMLIYILGFVLITTGISLYFGFSPLLANMALGVGVVNFTGTYRTFDALRAIDWPLYLLFFVLAGASLEIPLLTKIGLVGCIYVISRMIGVYLGALVGGIISHADRNMKKYMGLGLFTQAGVALGLAIIAKTEFPDIGNFIFSTIAATTIIFELIGPLTCKFAITRVGEAGK